MDDFVRKEVNQLNIRMELFSYCGAVPLGAFFLILAQKMYYQKFYYFVFSVLVAVIATVFLVPFLRKRIFYHLFNPLIEKRNSEEAVLEKKKVLRFPHYCGLLVQSQWIFGVLISIVIYYSLVPFSLFGLFSYFLLIVFLFPINYMIHSTIADSFLSKILAVPEIRTIPIRKEQIRTVTIFQRVGLVSFASLFLPVGVLISLYFFGSFSDADDPFRSLLVGLIGAQSVTVSCICSFLLAKILSRNIENVKEALNELKNGNLTYRMPSVDSEELGFAMAMDYNELTERLFSAVSNLKSTSGKLNSISLTLENNSMHTAKEALRQSSFAEELSAGMEEFQSVIIQTEENTEVQKNLSETCAESLLNLDREMQMSISLADESSGLSKKTSQYAEAGAALGFSAETAITEIQEESRAIIDYARLISEIADQVGLLSLNASIESARAGESGKGFKVVAGEISKLGESTNANSEMISKKVSVLSKKIKFGYEKILEVSERFKGIQDASSKTSQSMDMILSKLSRQAEMQNQVKGLILKMKDSAVSIRESSKEQRLIIEESNEGLERLTDSSELLSQSAETLRDISIELKKDAALLLTQIEFFRI